MEQKIHQLKCEPLFFMSVIAGEKMFEIRMDDRGFSVGDLIWLKEWSEQRGGYTGCGWAGKITYILRGFEGLAPGYCALGIDTFGESNAPVFRS
jgi:hypothetical protein